MLNRSSTPQYVSSPVDRLQTAMVFAMLGSFLGVLGLAAAFWLYQLHGRIQDQGGFAQGPGTLGRAGSR